MLTLYINLLVSFHILTQTFSSVSKTTISLQLQTQLLVGGGKGSIEILTPATSHREYWRRRTNSKWDATAQPARSDHPCDPNSKWRRYSYVRQDYHHTLTSQQNPTTFEVVPAEADFTSTIYEADSLNEVSCGSCDFKNNITNPTRYGYSGAGYYDFAGTGDYLEFTVNMEEAGTHPVSFRYSISSSSFNGRRPLQLFVNNSTLPIVESYDFVHTDSWDYYKYSELVDIDFVAGNNTIKLVVSEQNGGPNIDHMRIGKPAAVVMKTNGKFAIICLFHTCISILYPFSYNLQTLLLST